MGSLSTVAAQGTGTPTAGKGNSAVTVYTSDGQPDAEFSVNAIVDPYTQYDPSAPPDRGFHFIAVEVSIKAVGANDVQLSPYGFQLVDADGFLSPLTYIYRTPDATAAQP